MNGAAEDLTLRPAPSIYRRLRATAEFPRDNVSMGAFDSNNVRVRSWNLFSLSQGATRYPHARQGPDTCRPVPRRVRNVSQGRAILKIHRDETGPPALEAHALLPYVTLRQGQRLDPPTLHNHTMPPPPSSAVPASPHPIPSHVLITIQNSELDNSRVKRTKKYRWSHHECERFRGSDPAR